MSILVHPLTVARVDEARAFLAAGGAADTFLAHALDDTGVAGFVGAFEDRAGTLGALLGLVRSARGAVGVAARTELHAAAALGAWVAANGAWASVLGAEAPAGIVSALLQAEASAGATAEVNAGARAETKQGAQVDRRQVLMTATPDDVASGPDPGVRPAAEVDLACLVPMVASYRVEDGLAASVEPLLPWLEWRLAERVRDGELWVVEQGGELVYTAAFNFRGPCGAGLGGIYTAPSHRGRGIGRHATAELARRALTDGPIVTLHVDETNEPALRCYAAAGFRRGEALRLTFK